MHSSSARPSIETKPELFSAISRKQSCINAGGLWALVEGTACSKGRVRCVGEEWARVRGGGRARLLEVTLVVGGSSDGSSMLKAANVCSASLPLLTWAPAPVVTEASDFPSSGGILMMGEMMRMLKQRGRRGHPSSAAAHGTHPVPATRLPCL